MANPHIIKILPSLLQHHFTEPIIRNHMINVIGYGSGVFPQQSTVQKNNNTIDLIIITKSASNFHSHFHNFKSSDYEGFSRVFGPSYIKFLNSYVFPLHFNHITIQNYKVKYSIVDYCTLVEDLSKWKYLTLAGRMHKPVLSHPINTENNNKEISLISSQINVNYENALKIALLRLIGKKKTNIPFSQLYETISELSYLGDIRYTFAVENKNKVSNIVNNNLSSYHQIYLPILKKMQQSVSPNTIQLKQTTFSINFTPQLIHKLVQKLPQQIYTHLQKCFDNRYKGSLTNKILVKGVKQLPIQIENILKQINRKSSLQMALYNFLGGSIITNFNYILAKIKKRYFK